MKKLFDQWWVWVVIIVGGILLSIILETRACAEEKKFPLWLDAGAGYNIYQIDSDFRGGLHAEVRLGLGEDVSIYIPFTYDTMERSLFGQDAGSFTLLGPGLGAQVKIVNHLRLWGQIQYFFISSTMTGRDKNGEAHIYTWMKWQQDTGYTLKHPSPYGYNDYKINGGFGGAAGFEIYGTIWKKLSASASFGYRFAQFQERFKAADGFYELNRKADLSGVTGSIKVVWTF